MNFKIIETECDYADVLIYRDESEEGKPIAIVQCFGYISGHDEEEMICEIIEFETDETCKRFINDFSDFSANQWCKNREMMYSPLLK